MRMMDLFHFICFSQSSGMVHNLILQIKIKRIVNANDISAEDTKELSGYGCNNCTNKILCRIKTMLYSMGAIIASSESNSDV